MYFHKRQGTNSRLPAPKNLRRRGLRKAGHFRVSTIYPFAQFAQYVHALKPFEDVPFFRAFAAFSIAIVSCHNSLSNFRDESVGSCLATCHIFMGLKAKFQVVSFGTCFRGWGARPAGRDVPLSTLFTHTCHRSAPIALDGGIIKNKRLISKVRFFLFIFFELRQTAESRGRMV